MVVVLHLRLVRILHVAHRQGLHLRSLALALTLLFFRLLLLLPPLLTELLEFCERAQSARAICGAAAAKRLSAMGLKLRGAGTYHSGCASFHAVAS